MLSYDRKNVPIANGVDVQVDLMIQVFKKKTFFYFYLNLNNKIIKYLIKLQIFYICKN